MYRLIVSCFLLIFLVHVTMATMTKIFFPQLHFINQCRRSGDRCEQTRDCCSELICYSIQSKFSSSVQRTITNFSLGHISDENLCLSSDQYQKRYADDFIIPPYYNPRNYLYPYGSSMPPFPFYNTYEAKQSKAQQRNKMGKCEKKSRARTVLFFRFRMGSLSIS